MLGRCQGARLGTFSKIMFVFTFSLGTATHVFADHSCDANCEGWQTYQEQCQQAPIIMQPGAPIQPYSGAPFPGGTVQQTPTEPGATPIPTEGQQVVPDAGNLAAAAPPMDFTPQLARGTGVTRAGVGVPDMIGDFFGNGYNFAVNPGVIGNGTGSGLNLHGATVTAAGGDRRFKFAENNSPFPRNRLFFNYNHFHNALTDTNGQGASVNRYTFGAESTIFSDNSSFEIRIPFAGTLDATQDLGSSDFDATEFGNIAFAFKRLLYRNECTAVSAGLGIVVPTGSDGEIVANNELQMIFGNDALHLQPFIGVYRQTTDRLFWQFFTQLDFDVSGNDVVIPVDSAFNTNFLSFDEVNNLTDQTLLMFDLSFGYWLHRDNCARCVTGIAPMLELHYTTTTEDQDFGSLAGRGIFENTNRRDSLNLTSGLFLQLRNNSSLKLGVVSPLREGFDRMFDAEVGLQYTRGF